MCGMNLVLPFLPLYIEELGVQDLSEIVRWTGWIVATQFITSFLTQPLWGAIADRRGRKIMLLRAGFGMANLFGAPSLGRLGNRIGQRKTLVIALSMAALAFIPQSFANSITMLHLIAVPRQSDWPFNWQPS
jgi:MFS family permease